MQNAELVNKLRENVKAHMNPYNLGDMGETAKLVELACERIEKVTTVVEELNDKLGNLYATRDFALRGKNKSLELISGIKIDLLQKIIKELDAHQ
jgi:hypothetical protein